MTTDRMRRFRELAEQDPDNPLHLFALGQACLAADAFEEAEQAFARCLEQDGQWMMAAIRRGRCLVALQRYEEARQALDMGAELATRQGHEEPFEEIRELLEEIPGEPG